MDFAALLANQGLGVGTAGGHSARTATRTLPAVSTPNPFGFHGIKDARRPVGGVADQNVAGRLLLSSSQILESPRDASRAAIAPAKPALATISS